MPAVPGPDDNGPLFAILGPVELVAAAGDRVAPGGRKKQALLALMVLHRDRSLSAGQLVDDLWGDEAPGGAETTLRSHLSQLRRWLADLGADGLLSTSAAGYRLSPGRVDVEDFEDLIGTAQEALGLGRPEAAEESARAALALWRDRPLVELPEVEAAAIEVARLEELRLVALEVRGAAQLQRGLHREAVAELDALVGAHPFRERFCGQLMVALYRCGRQADALAAYAALRERLSDELGLDPGPELQGLSQQILRQDPGLAGDTVAPVPVAQAVAPEAEADLPDAILDAAARGPLVGRGSESRRLAEAWDSVGRGGRQVVVISGEPGIGKTRLVAEVAATASAARRSVLVGRCVGTGRPYHPVADLLASSAGVVRALAGLPDSVRAPLDGLLATSGDGREQTVSGNQQAALYGSFVQLLNGLSAAGPILVIIDDAERIDRASALLLRHVADRLPAGVLLVACFRDPPGTRHEPLGELIGALSGNGLVERIELVPLDRSGTEQLLAAAAPDLDPDTASVVWERTGGNPYFVAEVGRNLAAGIGGPEVVPAGIRDALRQRLRDLVPVTQQVLTSAAVLSGPVDFGVLSAVLDLGDDDVADALDDAVDAGFLVESGRSWAGAYSFPHDLLRDAVRGELTGQRLRRLHARCAQALAGQTTPGGPGSSAVALHLRGAGSAAAVGETVDWCLHAARESEALAAWDEAIEHTEAAVDLLGSGGPGSRLAEACVAAADLRMRSTRGYDRAVALLDVALREYTVAGDRVKAAAIHNRLGSALSLHHSVMDIPRALEHLDAAARLDPDRIDSFHLVLGRAQVGMFGLRSELLATAAAELATIVKSTDRPGRAVLADWASGWARLNAGDIEGAFDALEGSWRTAHDLADPTLGWGSVNAAALIANTYLLDPAYARVWCRRALGQPRFDTLEYGHETAADQLVQALCAQGDLPAARVATSVLSETATARRMLAFLEGRWEEAESSWAAAAAVDEAAGDLHDAVTNLRWLGRARGVLGDSAGTLEALYRALEICTAGPQVPSEIAVRADLARLLAASDVDAARAHLARALELSQDRVRWRGLTGMLDLAAAEVARAGGDHDGAEQHLADAEEVFGKHRLAWQRAEVHSARAALLVDRGDGDGAAAERTAAAGVYTSIGADDRWHERVSG